MIYRSVKSYFTFSHDMLACEVMMLVVFMLVLACVEHNMCHSCVLGVTANWFAVVHAIS
jgi:hypothetical protein